VFKGLYRRGMESESSDLALLIEARDAVRSGRGARLRLAAGISQGELAAAIGVSAPTLSRWEAGDRRPRGDAAVAYARELRKLAEQLVMVR
jgi:DNA-binding transcriptional regulator YiaG